MNASINPATGEITAGVPPRVISRSLTPDTLTASNVELTRENRRGTGDFYKGSVPLDDPFVLGLVLTFSGNHLQRVNLAILDRSIPLSTRHDRWRQIENEQWWRHHDWLTEQLGPPRSHSDMYSKWEFSWGEVISFVDHHYYEAVIGVLY